MCEALRDITQKEANQNGIDRDAALGEMQDARSRFKAWATSIAAFQEGYKQSSLDFRLREATEIRQRILNILESLAESLQEALLIASGAEPNEKWEAGALSDSEEDEEKAEGSIGKEVVETSELNELSMTIKMEITSLMKLSVVIRNSPSRDDYLKAVTRYSLDPRWDISHVNEKFGSAKRSTKWLIERLGKSITRRRQYLMYRKEHHGKLSRDWGGELEEDPEEDEKRTVANTKATTFVENKLHVNEEGSEVGSFGSQTSYEQTIAGETTEHRLTVPPPPKTAFEDVPFGFGNPFLCPYCFTEQTVKNKQGWKYEHMKPLHYSNCNTGYQLLVYFNIELIHHILITISIVMRARIKSLTQSRKHVFRDLRPYVCTFEECNLRMFGSRNEWFAHEIKIHRREWACVTCSKIFTSKSKFQDHLSSTHYPGMAGSEFEALVLQSEEPLDKIGPSACKLCDEWETNLRNLKHSERRMFLNEGRNVEPYGTLLQFRRHLGRHMEQLALFALPMAGEEAIEESDESDDGSNDLGEPQPLEVISNSTDANSSNGELIFNMVPIGGTTSNDRELPGASTEVPSIDSEFEDIAEAQTTLASSSAHVQEHYKAERVATLENLINEQARKYDEMQKNELKEETNTATEESKSEKDNRTLRDNKKFEEAMHGLREEGDAAMESHKAERAEMAAMVKDEEEYQKRFEDNLRKSGMDERQIDVVMKNYKSEQAEKYAKAEKSIAIEFQAGREKMLEEMRNVVVAEKWRAEKAAKVKKEEEEAYRKRLEDDLRKSGMDERQVEAVLKKGKGVDRNLPTYTRMSRRHLSIETLKTHNIEYEFDQVRAIPHV